MFGLSQPPVYRRLSAPFGSRFMQPALTLPDGRRLVLDDRTLLFPSYDGKGLYFSMGNSATSSAWMAGSMPPLTGMNRTHTILSHSHLSDNRRFLHALARWAPRQSRSAIER